MVWYFVVFMKFAVHRSYAILCKLSCEISQATHVDDRKSLIWLFAFWLRVRFSFLLFLTAVVIQDDAISTVFPMVIIGQGALLFITCAACEFIWWKWGKTTMPLEYFACSLPILARSGRLTSTFDCFHPYATTTRLIYKTFQPITSVMLTFSVLELIEFLLDVRYAWVKSRKGSYRITDCFFSAYWILAILATVHIIEITSQNVDIYP